MVNLIKLILKNKKLINKWLSYILKIIKSKII